MTRTKTDTTNKNNNIQVSKKAPTAKRNKLSRVCEGNSTAHKDGKSAIVLHHTNCIMRGKKISWNNPKSVFGLVQCGSVYRFGLRCLHRREKKKRKKTRQLTHCLASSSMGHANARVWECSIVSELFDVNNEKQKTIYKFGPSTISVWTDNTNVHTALNDVKQIVLSRFLYNVQ